MNLSEAQGARRAREEQALELAIEAVLDRIYAAMGDEFAAENASPADRKKLRGLIRHYMKMAHPFRACVRDNTKRFGKEGAEKVCATLKDIGKGTTKWRKGNKKGVMASIEISEPVTAIDDELATELQRFSRLDLVTVLDLDEEEN